MTMRVGFIGLGNMGEPLAGFVLKAGFPLVIHDVRKEAATGLLSRGALWAGSAREVAAQSDVICTCVPGPPEMKAVTLGAGGVIEGVTADAVVIDHTTNAPAVVREVGDALKARGAHLLDAPLDGGREGALEGQLTLFVRGDFAARFALALAYKDFRLAGDLATQHGVPTRLLDLCQMELLEAMNRGWGGQDRIKASTLQEERAGVKLRL